jgi:hypothetical protein
VDSEPETVLLPLQPPDATQEAALLDDHVRLAAAACWTVLGATASETAGGTGAGVGGAGVDAVGASPPPPQPARAANAKAAKMPEIERSFSLLTDLRPRIPPWLLANRIRGSLGAR